MFKSDPGPFRGFPISSCTAVEPPVAMNDPTRSTLASRETTRKRNRRVESSRVVLARRVIRTRSSRSFSPRSRGTRSRSELKIRSHQRHWSPRLRRGTRDQKTRNLVVAVTRQIDDASFARRYSVLCGGLVASNEQYRSYIIIETGSYSQQCQVT